MPDLGDTLPFRADVYDKPAEEGGVLTTASSAVLTITLPDGTTATPTVPAPSTAGKYAVDYPTTAASPQGRYVGKWLFTFAGGATTSYMETFDVGGSLVTVDEALAHLRLSGINPTEDQLEYLQWLCFVATDAVERDLGRVMTPRTIVETHDGGGSIILNQTPVLSITSVSETGSSLSEYVVNAAAGVLYRGTTSSMTRFRSGVQNVVVTYLAGYYNPPPVVRKVALNAIQGMWQGSQQAPHPALTEYNDVELGTAVAALTPLEQRAYESLQAAGVA